MGEENWRLMTLCLLTAVVALLMVLSIHLHQDVKYWQVRKSAAAGLPVAPNGDPLILFCPRGAEADQGSTFLTAAP